MDDPHEYLKLKYIGDCKCGNCQLVPAEALVRWQTELSVLRRAFAMLARLDPGRGLSGEETRPH